MSEATLGGILAPVAAAHGVALDKLSLQRIYRYARLLLQWNERLNLSGARDLSALAREHFADALPIAGHLPPSGSCLDVGSGAGLPGVVLAVLRPDLRFVLLEPSQKRTAFLAAVARELDLSNVSIARERLEAHAAKAAHAYDFAVARAVFPLEEWLARAPVLVRPRGLVVGLAGGELRAELPPGATATSYEGADGRRTMILVRVA